MTVITTPAPDGATTYTNAKWRVTIGPMGEIAVAQGDWISKYSAAIHDRFEYIYEYARKDRSGRLIPVSNPNRITSGETLFHIPTWNAAQKGEVSFKPITIRVPTDAEKDRIIADFVKQELDLPGDTGWVLTVVKWLGRLMGPAAGAANIVTIIGNMTVGAGVSAVIGVAGPLGMICGYMFSIYAGQNFGLRLFALKSAAYATTAWAFGDPMPQPPHRAMREAAAHHGANSEEWLKRYEKAWKDGQREAIRNLEATYRKQGKKKIDYQLALRALGEDNKKLLASKLFNMTMGKVSAMGVEQTQHRLYARQIDYPR